MKLARERKHERGGKGGEGVGHCVRVRGERESGRDGRGKGYERAGR